MRTTSALLLVLAFTAPLPADEIEDKEPVFLGLHWRPAQSKEGPAGLYIISVVQNGPAEKAGLKSGDIVTALDGAPVLSVADGSRLKDGRKPGDRMGVKFWREGKEQTTEVALGDATLKPVLSRDLGGHTARVWKVFFTPDSQQVISVSEDGAIRIWDARGGECLRVLHPCKGSIQAALSPNGRTLALGGSFRPDGKRAAITLVSLPAGQIERVIPTDHSNNFYALTFSADGRLLASANMDKTARIFDTRTWECIQVLKGHLAEVSGVCFSPDGRRVATSSYDSTAAIWSVATGKKEVELAGHKDTVRCIAWSPDGKMLATGSIGKNPSVQLWLADGTPKRRFAGLGWIPSVCFSGDSRELLIAGNKGEDASSYFLDVNTGKQRSRFQRWNSFAMDCALSRTGGLAALGLGTGQVYLWHTRDGKLAGRLAGKGKVLWTVAWSKDGKSLAWGHHPASAPNTLPALERSFDLDNLQLGPPPTGKFNRAVLTQGDLKLQNGGAGAAIVWQGKKKLATLQLPGQREQVHCFTFLPDDRVAVGGTHGLYLFDTRSGKLLRKIYPIRVNAVAPSPDGCRLAFATSFQLVFIHDLKKNARLLGLCIAGNDWVLGNSRGYYASSAGGDSLIGWLVKHGPRRMATFYPAGQFRKRFYRPDVVKLILEHGDLEKALTAADKARGKSIGLTDVQTIVPPQVRITSPATTTVRATHAKIEVKALASSVGKNPVTSLILLLNGRPYEGKAARRAVAQPRLGEVQHSWTIKLSPGKHHLKVLADSAVSQGHSETVEVVYVGEDPAEPQLPDLYVLAVGVAAYPDDALKLNYAADDARILTRVLLDKSKPLFRKIEVKLLTDREATRSAILKGLGWLRKEATSKDYAMVFFSGHGDKDSDGSFYLLPHDADTKDIASSCIPGAQFKNLLMALPGKALLLLDACHSGGIDGGKRKGNVSLTDDLMRDLVTDESGLVVMCSSTGREFSLENNEYRHSNFTQAIVEGLMGKAARGTDSAVYLHHLDGYVIDRVKELSEGRQHPVTAKPSSIRSFPLSMP